MEKLSAFFLLFISLQAFSQGEIKSLDQCPKYDVIIVPGVPHNGESWSRTMQDRVNWAVYLYKNGYTENIIFSGSAVYTAYEEASIMALYAEKMGVSREHILLDSKAEHSTENIYYSYQIAKEKEFNCIAFATDPFQGYGLKSFIKKFDFPIEIIPINYDTLATLDLTEPSIDADLALRQNFVSIVERESKWKRFKGTMGQNIQWVEEDLKTRRLKRKYGDCIVKEDDDLTTSN